MNEEILISKEEFVSLNERVKKLAEEKSYLELFTHLMEKMSSVSGLENTIHNLLQILLENIGGSNVIIYYLIDNEIFYSDVLGKKESIKEISDEIVKKVFETKTSVEYQGSFDDTKLLSSEFTKANVWAFPLEVGSELIAVIKIENLYVTTSDLRFHLPTFFSFAAHILKNEILGHSKLKAAYDELTHENNLRKQAEAELRAINEELGDSVDARTIELQNVNAQLKEELEIRKQTESQIRKLNRIYAVLSNINQAIVRIRNTKDIFDEACRIAVEYGKFPMVWVGIVNSRTNKVDVTASSGVQHSYLENLDIDLNDEQRSSGPTGIAIKSGKHKISNNILDDDSMRLWQNDATQYGYKSTASFPLIVFNKVVGAFCIYSDELNFFEDDDVVLLDEMVKDISFAMEYSESEIERRNVEEALRQASSDIHDLYNYAPCGYHSIDINGIFVRINKTELNWLGYTREEIIGTKKFSDIITPKSFEVFKQNFPIFIEKGLIKDLEFELIRKDGTLLPVLLSATAIKDADGNFLMSRSTLYDITDLKKTQQQLIDSEREFRTLAENIPDHIIRYDLDCRVIYLNHVTAATKYTDSSLVGKLSAEIQFNEAESIEEYNEKLRRVIKTGAEDEMEIMIRDIEGNPHIHEVHFLAEHDANGNITGALAIGRDISERKLAEKERQANLRFFENMDKINRAIQEATDAEQMMSDVLDIILATFDCDRASLVYPCDPEAAFWKVPIEKTKPEYTGALVSEIELPMEEEAERVFKAVLATNNPVGFGPGNEESLPTKVAEGFNIKSQLAIGLHPKVNKAWMFVLHQCSKSRSWTSNERKLFKEISIRLTDGLTSLLTLRNLLESERRLTEAQRIANVGYWERDFINNKIILSGESCRIFGLPQENYHEKLDEWHRQWLQLILPEDKERAEKAVIDAVHNDIPYNLDYRIIRHNGELRYVHSEANVRRDSSGKPVFMLGMMQDITERKRAEESLRESEMKLRVMFENSRDAIGVSKKGIHVFANPAYLKLFGYEKLEELVGTPILDCVAQSHHQQIIENVQRRVSGENVPLFYETRGRKRDGSEFDFEINVSTYELHNEIFTLANIRDITSRKLMEKALFFVAQRSWQTGEENFFDSLAQFLGENLDMDYAIIDKIGDNPAIAETIALFAKGSIVPNMRYELKGTPCENVMGRQLCFYSKEVQKLFPEDRLLADMGVESYLGIPLWDSFGKPIGLIALMSNKPHPEDSGAIQVLQLVATRAAAELERERSDRILRKREYEFRTLAENSPDNIMRYDIDGRMIYANSQPETKVGYDESDFMGKTPLESFPNGFYEGGRTEVVNYQAALQLVLSSGDKMDVEMHAPDGYGGFRIHSVRIAAERDAEDNLVGALAFGRDITERKRAEEALYKERNLLRIVIDNLPDGIWTKDLNCRKTLANLANVYMTGRKSENEILGKDDYELFPKELAESFMIDDRSVIETGKPVINREEYVVSENGQKHFLLTTKLPFLDEKGRMIGLIGISRDITERKLAEEALLRSEERYRLIAENTADTISVLEMDLTPIYISPSVYKMRGITVDEALSLSLDQVLTHESSMKAKSVLAEQLMLERSGKSDPTRTILLELEMFRKDGSTIWVEMSASFLRDKNHNPNKILTVTRDITERKRAEIELKEQMSEINRFNKLMVGREEKMIELKKEINLLLEKEGKPKKYDVHSLRITKES